MGLISRRRPAAHPLSTSDNIFDSFAISSADENRPSQEKVAALNCWDPLKFLLATMYVKNTSYGAKLVHTHTHTPKKSWHLSMLGSSGVPCDFSLTLLQDILNGQLSKQRDGSAGDWGELKWITETGLQGKRTVLSFWDLQLTVWKKNILSDIVFIGVVQGKISGGIKR